MVFAASIPIGRDEYDDAARRAREAAAQRRRRSPTSPRPRWRSGFGFRCGFLGLLHMEIIQERLEREYDLDLITTAPTRRLPRAARPTARCIDDRQPGASCPTPQRHREHRGADHRWPPSTARRVRRRRHEAVRGAARRRSTSIEYLGATRVMLDLRAAADRDRARLLRPAEDRSAAATPRWTTSSSATAPATWSSWTSWSTASRVDALSSSSTATRAYTRGRELGAKLQGADPAAACSRSRSRRRSAARSSPARRSRRMRKNVTAKCYGGDITRKRKLLEKQKEGKKRMKQVGNVEIPRRPSWRC